MSSRTDERSHDGKRLRVAGVTEADCALLLAMRAWGHECARPQADANDDEHHFIFRFREWLDAGRVRRLCDAWDCQMERGDGLAPARALERVRKMHVASVE